MGLFTLKKKAKVLWRGLKRVVIACWTANLFALSVYAFIAAATAIGYWSVILFLSAIVLMGWGLLLLYVQGNTDVESRGEIK